MTLLCITSCETTKPVKTFIWLPTECAPELYPANIAMGNLVFEDGSKIYIPSADPVENGWGNHGSTDVVGSLQKPVPVRLDLTWLSYTEKKFYTGSFALPQEYIIKLFEKGYTDAVLLKHGTYDVIAVGMAPGGVVVVWIQGMNHQVEIGRYQARQSNITMQHYRNVKGYSPEMTNDINELCNGVIQQEPVVAHNLKVNGLQLGLWDNYRQRFSIRPVMSFDQPNQGGVTEIYLNYFNGEQEDMVLDDLKKNDFKPRSRIKKAAFKWTGELDGKRKQFVLELNHLDEKEIFNAYKEVFAGDPQQQAELMLQVTPGNNQYHLYLKNQTRKVELLKGRGEIYLDE
jgi:hypothetical protein